MRRLCAIDLETTGSKPTVDQIVEFSVIFSHGESSVEGEEITHLVRPIREISPKASEIHGYTSDMLKDCHLFSEYAWMLSHYLTPNAVILVGYNIRHFDIPLLKAEFARCNIDWTPPQSIDLFHVYSNRSLNSLKYVAQDLLSVEMPNIHGAYLDASVCLDILIQECHKPEYDIFPAINEVREIVADA